MQRRIVPDIVDGSRPLTVVAPDSPVAEVAKRLRNDHVAAALVVDAGRLVGIVTERDITYRVVAEGRNPAAVRAADIMTPEPVTGRPDQTAKEALDMMREGHFRHLPVLRDGELFAVVSIRDLYEAVRRSLEEDLQQAETFLHGEVYGTGT